MSKAYTKWLKQTIAEMQEHAELFPGDIDADHGKVLKALRIALASLEAEPVAWDYEWASCITCEGPQNFKLIIEREAPPEWAIHEGQARNLIPLYAAPPAPIEAEPVAYMWDSDRKDVDAPGYYRPEHKIFAESSVKRYGGKVVALYAAPPAPVANIHPLLEFAREYIESWDLGMAGDSSLLARAKQAIADSSAHQPAPVSVPDERAAFNAWNNDTDCPLAGRDAKTAAWLAWCRRAAMLQGAEPVTTAYKLPEGWVSVPVDATRAMIDAARRVEEDGYDAMHKAMIAAAPLQEVE